MSVNCDTSLEGRLSRLIDRCQSLPQSIDRAEKQIECDREELKRVTKELVELIGDRTVIWKTSGYRRVPDTDWIEMFDVLNITDRTWDA